jgi:hypothetical protein
MITQISDRLTKASQRTIHSSNGVTYGSTDNLPGLINELSAILAELYSKVEALEDTCNEFECGHSAYEHNEHGCNAGLDNGQGWATCSCKGFKKVPVTGTLMLNTRPLGP